jgi:hypothetical protein
MRAKEKGKGMGALRGGMSRLRRDGTPALDRTLINSSLMYSGIS